MPSPLPTEFHLPRPVLSVLPGHEVAVGTSVIFRCTIAHSSAGCFLYLEGQLKVLDLLSKEQDYFNLARVHKGNGGRYSCQCFSKSTSLEWSAVSKTLDLVVRGETSHQPQSTLLFLPGIYHILGELEKRMWGKEAAAIWAQAEDCSCCQMCLSLASSPETL